MASAECNRLVFEAVDEFSVAKFQSVRASYSQIDVLASLLQRDEDNQTPLEIAIIRGNVEFTDELIIFLQRCDRSVVESNLMSEAINQLFHPAFPIVKLIEQLINESNDSILNWLDIFVQVVLKSTSLSRPDKISALELVGASLPKYHGGSFAVIFRYWREAMKLRHLPAHGELPLPKTPYVGDISAASLVVFGPAEEIMTMEDLNLFEEDFVRDVFDQDEEVQQRGFDLLRRQSLLVIRRIASQADNGHPNACYILSLYEFVTEKMRINEENEDEDQDVNAIDIARYTVMNGIVFNTFLLILEQVTDGFDPKLLPRKSFDVFFKTLAFGSYWLSFMAKKPLGYPVREDILSHANLLAFTKLIGKIAKFFTKPIAMSSIDIADYEFEELLEYMGFNATESYHGFAKIIFDLVFVLKSISSRLSNREKQELEQYYSNYIRKYFPTRKTTALHVAVAEENLKTELIQFILQLGADPNEINEYGQTPLHILSGRKVAYLDKNIPIFKALLEAGTHRDTSEDNGDTVLDILKRNLERFRGSVDVEVEAEAYLSCLINAVLPLTCYCARVIRQNGIPFDGDRLPLDLQPFVSRHSDNGFIDRRRRV
ncbi:hypothetical protein DAPPUDRAFT_327440 [Daphnia pulex]|uniref:Ankyrin repeat domain-containing protein 54 n=1 Tax=Daphnia pulex TaxID=6669 RepID=E9HAR9_DAPPU|nr:hypothetical protein DAPPUDRAFT_327440 [Daphnia pulex]|eukprot:EFX71167.1 hypothetical protein DAPPUDRAFT_327440 [Daphnia pulex]